MSAQDDPIGNHAGNEEGGQDPPASRLDDSMPGSPVEASVEPASEEEGAQQLAPQFPEGLDAPQSEAPPEKPLFAQFEYLPTKIPPRRPHFGHLLVFVVLAYWGLRVSILLVFAALHYHFFGVSTPEQAEKEIHYALGSQAAWYLITLLFCMLTYPLLWRGSFFAGLHWCASGAIVYRLRLIGAAFACFVVAMVDQVLLPGPENAPIDQTFRMPGAAWLLFGFGVTLAPLAEEIAFRGFLLPSLCTAYDWAVEQLRHERSLQPGDDGHPRWSMSAMVVASVLTSAPFALMHGYQTAYSVGPFLLLFLISLVLCWVRLATRSLAASVMVHASYNLLLFALMYFGTGGFRHLDNM